MIALLFFFFDLLAYVFLGRWVVYSLLGFFLIRLVRNDFTYSVARFWLPLGLLLVQSSMITGRFGLSLIYLIPMIFIAAHWRGILLNSTAILPFIFMIIAIIVEVVGFKVLLHQQNPSFFVTIMKIFVNVSIEFLILLGTRGNRSLPFGRGRKVWTPNRMDAS